MGSYRLLETDVLVVGAGGAGARAAIAARECGASVLLATKHFLGRSGCTPSIFHISAVGSWSVEGDSPELAMRDLLEEGGYLGNQDLLKILMEESHLRVADLERYGARFDKRGGKLVLYQAPGHSKPRTFSFQAKKGGITMIDALSKEVRRLGVQVLEEIMVTRLFTDGGAVIGAGALDCAHGEFYAIGAGSVVLATGGYGAIYSPTTVAREDTGDGHALALNVGADLMDMEGFTFLPGNRAIMSAAAPKLMNAYGDRFMTRYNPEGLEFATKEVLVRAIATEVKEGRGTKRGGVYSDLRHLNWKDSRIHNLFYDLVEWGRRFGFDPRREPVEAWPIAHTSLGGIRVDEHGRTSVPGLYATGAVAGGIYGLARIVGFTSMITQVFGKRTGEAAAAGARLPPRVRPAEDQVQQERDRVFGVLEQRGGIAPARMNALIHSIMYDHAWILKTHDGLSQGLAKILDLAQQKVSISSSSTRENHEWMEALEVPNLILMSEMVLRGSIMRKESRGAFFRLDFPDTDNDNWLRNIIYRKVQGELELFAEPVVLKYFAPKVRGLAPIIKP